MFKGVVDGVGVTENEGVTLGEGVGATQSLIGVAVLLNERAPKSSNQYVTTTISESSAQKALR